MPWFVYIVECHDRSLYTGITNNIDRRIKEHNTNNTVGSRYVRSRRPATLVFQQPFHSRSEALKRESEIKKLTRHAKLKLVSTIQMK